MGAPIALFAALGLSPFREPGSCPRVHRPANGHHAAGPISIFRPAWPAKPGFCPRQVLGREMGQFSG